MSYSKVIKFDFCQLYCKKKERNCNYELFDIEKLIYEIDKQQLALKEVEVYTGLKVRVENFDFDKENGLWRLRVLRLRDSNLAFVVKPDEQAKPIELGDDEYLGEDLTMLFDVKNNIAMIQRNRFAMGFSNLERFVQKIIGEDTYRVEIRAISKESNIKAIRKDYFKSVEIRFANLKDKDVDIVGGPLGDIIRAYKKFDGGGGSFVVNLGRTRKESLSKEPVKEFINEIADNQELFSAAVLKAKNAEDHDLDIINLFENVFSVYIWFEIAERSSLQYKDCVKKMTEEYLKNKTQLLIALGVITVMV